MQLGFDRLIRAMDQIAPQLTMPVFAQTGPGSYDPGNMTAKATIAPEEFDRLISSAKLLVSHAGIGTLLVAQRLQKPIIMFPRRAALREHRNDHQLATVNGLDGRPGVIVAMEEAELPGAIARGLAMAICPNDIPYARAQLEQAVGAFIRTGKL
jgi:UDP-N-acetylglucosamine transferase subunit ALG13